MGARCPQFRFAKLPLRGRRIELLRATRYFIIMSLSANYAQPAYGQVIYGTRGAAAYFFSTSEAVASADSPASKLQANGVTSDNVAGSDQPSPMLHANDLAIGAVTASDLSTYNAFIPISIFGVDVENRESAALHESRQPMASPEDRQTTPSDKRNFTA